MRKTAGSRRTARKACVMGLGGWVMMKQLVTGY
jgi:hypothetical protein